MGFLDIVAQMDGGEEMIEEAREVEGIESAHGFMVFAIGAAFLHGLVDEVLIVVAIGKLNDLSTYENI